MANTIQVNQFSPFADTPPKPYFFLDAKGPEIEKDYCNYR